MVCCVILNVRKDTLELVQFAGKNAQRILEMTELSVLNLPPMVEEQVTGVKVSVKTKIQTGAKNMDFYITQNAKMISTTLDAVYAPLTALRVNLTLACLVPKNLTEEALELPSHVKVENSTTLDSATNLALKASKTLVQFVGDNVLLITLLVELYA